MRTFRTSRFRRGPLPFRHVLAISFFIFLILTIQGLWIINKSIEPTLMTYAKMETNRLATLIITKAVNEEVKKGFQVDKLITAQTDNQGSVSAIDVNAEIVNSISTSITASVEKYLNMAERGETEKLGIHGDSNINLAKNLKNDGVLFAVPLGQITKNALIGNLGPKIPVSFTTIGHVRTNVKPNIKAYGINTTAVEVLVEVEVTMQVIIPFETKETVVKTDVPVALHVIQGKVPDYYNGGKEGASPALPAPKKN
ncbi:sporulation protein YunB [Ectobacillus panaciterrae]|uniref:sporulation protein YunB n=1 Tax=Ectobacillus panaciterrae TaxID=363872 RepID=UPI0004242B9D|nr:sporulation protein YunB [Ectobacillus panaciterrae]